MIQCIIGSRSKMASMLEGYNAALSHLHLSSSWKREKEQLMCERGNNVCASYLIAYISSPYINDPSYKTHPSSDFPLSLPKENIYLTCGLLYINVSLFFFSLSSSNIFASLPSRVKEEKEARIRIWLRRSRGSPRRCWGN